MKPSEAHSITLNSKHPEANSKAIEPIIRQIAPGIEAIHWIESDSEDLVLDIDGESPHGPVGGDPEQGDGNGDSRSFQEEVMNRLRG